MKLKLFTFFILLVLAYSCAGECEEENAKLKDQITEYEQQEELTALAMNDYDEQIQEYKVKDDSLSMFRDSIDVLASKMRSSGRASNADNKAMNSYMAEMQRILADNRKLTASLSQYVDSADIGDNPALVVQVLAQNLDTKEQEILDLQTQLESLQKEVTGLKVKVEKITVEKDELAEANTELETKNTALNEKAQILEISKVRSSIINKKGKDITRTLIKRLGTIKTLKVCFSIKENKFAEMGSHQIYIAISKSDNVLHNSKSTWFTSEQGKEIGYTKQETINYKGSSIYTCSNWDIGDNKLVKGTYEVTIYDKKGNQIGSSFLSL